MGIDYDACYGIGFEVVESDLINGELLEDGLEEYIDNKLALDSLFKVFKPGNHFTGDMGNVFIVIKEPFSKGCNLEWGKDLLEKEISRLKLEVIGEFGVCGGLRVW